MEELKLEESKKLKITIKYGNKHELVADPKASGSDKTQKNKHKWTAFVSIDHPKVKSKDMIESVKFELHETFRNPIREVKKAPFEVPI